MQMLLALRQDKRKAHADLSRASFICWYLWRARNELVFNGKAWTPTEVLIVAEKAFQEFAAATLMPGGLPPASFVGTPQTCQHWEPPPVGVIKVNCDAVLPKGKAKGGLGLIFRDHTGAQCMARSIPHNFGTIIQGEVLAIRSALLAALEWGFENILVETDSRDAVLFIEGGKSPVVEVEDLIADVARLLPSFSSVAFSFVPRAMNVVSNALPRKALSLVCVTDWPNSIRWLHDLCVLDATSCTHPHHQ
ncbi:uncharacterized protein LOC122655069 [Telopea speciosissima]|uniref:uncharacterized protein LOC122655069 n=1 Tax=Telopea speciosissima TaxID=54955 RepID=UPI001CC49DCA|nr:uncharacterized protein LOC122655069 [Telopea speciosissima]